MTTAALILGLLIVALLIAVFCYWRWRARLGRGLALDDWEVLSFPAIAQSDEWHTVVTPHGGDPHRGADKRAPRLRTRDDAQDPPESEATGT